MVWDTTGWHRLACSRSGVIERAGKWYCRQHDPEAKKARDDKRRAKFVAEEAARTARHALNAHRDKALDKLRAATTMPGVLSLVNELLIQEDSLKAEYEALRKKAEELSK